MTPADEAIELIGKFYYCGIDECDCKKCALIAVDELIKETQFEVPNIRQRYWQQVKQEINGI